MQHLRPPALARRGALVAICATFFVRAAPLGVAWVRLRGLEAREFLQSNLHTARVRVFGEKYVAGIEAIESAIPLDGSYYYVRTGRAGGPIWVRYDLAPRRATYLGALRGVHRMLDIDEPPTPPRSSWVVITKSTGEAPELKTFEEYFGPYPHFAASRRDKDLPASIDAPEPKALVEGDLVVQGWCQGLGGMPCSSIRFWIDDHERQPDTLARCARPDVAAARPDVGVAGSAGYRAVFGFGGSGEHELLVFFTTADGRYRRLGPVVFSWSSR